MLRALHQAAERKTLARQLCAELIEQSRAPEFFTRLGVPDTLDGRFDLVALHAWVVLESIGNEASLGQALIDEIFLNFDEALREIGTGDAGMNRRRKTLAGMFYGRLQAYRTTTTREELAAAIQRNIYRGAEERSAEASALATYASGARSRLKQGATRSPLDFGPIPGMRNQ